MLRLFSFLLILLWQVPAIAQVNVTNDQDDRFYSWLDDLRREAKDSGISSTTLDLAFAQVTLPVKRIIKRDRNQAEVVQSYSAYLSARVSQWKQDKGKEMLALHGSLLSEISREYGVSANIIAAIWGMETNYGTYPITEPIFNVLATLAYDTRRADFFRAQFLAALTILESGFPGIEQMKSSWAGAMGQPQFIPESYLALAVDYNNDGKRDIWDAPADVFASIANYFRARGWQRDQGWGVSVTIPSAVINESSLSSDMTNEVLPASHCKRFRRLGVWRTASQWHSLGVQAANNGDGLSVNDMPAALVLADAEDNKGYLVYENFCTIMSYNPAEKYALSIGLLADSLISIK